MLHGVSLLHVILLPYPGMGALWGSCLSDFSSIFTFLDVEPSPRVPVQRFAQGNAAENSRC